MALPVGTQAPSFTLKSHDGGQVSLASYIGRRNVVLAFFPLAWTPV